MSEIFLEMATISATFSYVRDCKMRAFSGSPNKTQIEAMPPNRTSQYVHYNC